jgi:hypothetical protein
LKVQWRWRRMGCFTALMAKVSFSSTNKRAMLIKGDYFLPHAVVGNDDFSIMTDVLTMLWNKTLKNKLYLSRLDSCRRVLDVGTGKGDWAIEFGMSEQGHLILSSKY